jgi:endoribonuclease LACTB2
VRAPPAAAAGGADAQAVVPGAWRIEVPVRTLPPFTTTNSYVLAEAGVALVVDPGSDSPAAIEAVARTLRAAGSEAPKGVVLTHTHRDHIGGVAKVLELWPDTTVYVHPLELGRLDASWGAKGLAGGRRLTLGGEVVEAVHTPGHSRGHLALWLARSRLLLAGDLVAGAGSVWVGVPDGDMVAYLESLAVAAALEPLLVAPGHGPLRHDGTAVLNEARTHRLAREAAVLAALRDEPRDLAAIRAVVYPALAAEVVGFAERSLLAHLLKLMAERRVMHLGGDEQGPYALSPGGG